ncbi:MAG: hypothetical protein K2J86_03630, partial [Prevotella sp.]|nr:hypothetical protein [Prevotella sp.]
VGSVLWIRDSSSADSNMRTEAVWNKNGKQIITLINRTPEGNFYIVTTDIYKGERPQDVKLTIREINTEFNWTNNIYKDISIIYIPKYLK